MQIEEKYEGDILIITAINTRLDVKVADDFKEKMAGHIENGRHLIVLNISQVEFIDSSGLGAIIYIHKLLKGEGKLVLCGIKDSIMRMFTLTRMNKVFSMFDTEKEAIESMTKE